MELNTTDGYRHLLETISETYTQQGQVRAMRALNTQLVQTYGQQALVEFEQSGQIRAEYGKAKL